MFASKNKYNRSKRFFLSGIVLILIAAILLFLFPGFLRRQGKARALTNRRYSIWDQRDVAERLSGRNTDLEDLFYENFLENFEKEGKDSKFKGVLHNVAISSDDSEEIQKSEEFWLSDQFLYGKYLALSEQSSEFSKWRKMIEELYQYENSWVLKLNRQMEVLDKTENTWTYDLKYAEILLTAYNIHPSKSLRQQIEAVMARVKPYFEAPQLSANISMEVEQVYFPETSSEAEPSANPELINPYSKEEFIRLSDVNLFVLESFSLLDPVFQPFYEEWLEVFRQAATLSDTFYPFGVFPDQKHFIMSGEEAFATYSEDNIKILYQNPNTLDRPALSGFYKRTISRQNNLLKAYHIATRQGLGDDIDIISLSLFSQYVTSRSTENSADTEMIMDAVRIGFELQRYDDPFSPMDQLYHQTIVKGEPVNFASADQLAILISGLIK